MHRFFIQDFFFVSEEGNGSMQFQTQSRGSVGILPRKSLKFIISSGGFHDQKFEFSTIADFQGEHPVLGGGVP